MSIDVYPPRGLLVPGTEQKILHIMPTWRNQATGAVIQAGWTPTDLTSADIWWVIPSDYAGGNVTFSLIRSAGGAAGTAVMFYQIYRNRDGTAQTQITADTSINFTPGDTVDHSVILTQVAGSIQAGDNLRLIINRDGNNASDTMTTTAYFNGLSASYTANVSRVFNAQPYEEGSFTVTATGFSGTAPSGIARYVRVGKQVTLVLPSLSGTSNSTLFAVVGIPVSLAPSSPLGNYIGIIHCVDNGVSRFGMFFWAAGGTSINLHSGPGFAAFTATGDKQFQGALVTYLLA